jgi:uncharacterized protein (DUF983 family)
MEATTGRAWWWALLRQRCPNCRTGRIFTGMTRMNLTCPDCGRQFIREEGYFLGALYVSYGLSMAILGAMTYGGSLLLPTWDLGNVVLVAAVCYIPLMPWVFRTSRVIWMYCDYWVWPSKR